MLGSFLRVSLLFLASLACACTIQRDVSDRSERGDDSKCQPACTGAACGQSDGCGGTCAGSCEGNLVCSAAKVCEEGGRMCTPLCVKATCGAADGCGGKCAGSCAGDLVCSAAKVCEEPGEVCSPTCAAAACGASDGCGGKCLGTCENGLSCNASTKACEAPAAGCLLPSSLGVLGDVAGDSMGDEIMVDFYYDLPIDADEASLSMGLWDGYGAFAGGLKTGNVSLTGVETGAESCGACVFLFVKKGAKEVVYMPNSGTLALSSVTNSLIGSLTNVSFREVLIDEETGETTDVPGGCLTHLTSASFDAEILPAE